jgi:acylphosphatase
MKSILSKLKGVMTEEDLGKFESAVKDMIDEKVKILVEGETKKLEEKAEEFCTKEVSERLKTEKENLIKEYDTKLEKFENNIVEKLDLFLETEITSNISDEMITKIAINETYRPIVEEIQKIFEEKFVALDAEGFGILKEAKEEIVKLEEEVSNNIASKMELQNESDKQKSLILFLEKTDGLNKTQKDKVLTLIEGKDYVDVKKTISSIIDLVTEQEEKEEKKVVAEVVEEEQTSVIEETTKPKKKNTLEEDIVSAASTLA